MASSPPVVGCLVEKGLEKGGHGDPRTPLATPLQPFENVQYLPLKFDSVYFLQFWNFKAKKLLYNLTFEIPITQILLHRERFVSQGSYITFPLD